MDSYLVHRAKCRNIVIIEMVLAGLRMLLITFSVFEFIYYYSTSQAGDVILSHFLAHYWIFFSVLSVDTVLFILGKKVLQACRGFDADFRKGIWACRTWCRLELFRMLIFVISFLIDVYKQQFNEHQYMIQIPILLVLLFGWFFVNEYRKELMTKSTYHSQMITQPVNGFQSFQEPQVVYCAPSMPSVYNYQC